LYNKNTINQKEWHVATKRLKKKASQQCTNLHFYDKSANHRSANFLSVLVRFSKSTNFLLRNKEDETPLLNCFALFGLFMTEPHKIRPQEVCPDDFFYLGQI
jgi:hypothetical protein